MRFAVVVMVIAACGKGDGTSAGGSGSTPRDGVLAAWKSGGLAPSVFAAANSPVGKDCATGTVNNVDVLVCNFASATDATAAVDAGLKWVGDTTGISVPKGTVLIVAADRKKADPTGSTINKLTKLAP